jgi:hypothetical protein
MPDFTPTDVPYRLAVSARTRLLLSAGTVLTFGKEELRFDLTVNGESGTLIFEFVEEPNVVPRHDFLAENKTTVRFRFHNFRTSMVANGPIQIGSLGGMNVWIVYEVSASRANSDIFKIVYSVFIVSPGDEPRD